MKPISVLVVDDEAEFIDSLGKLLRRRGFEVEVAADGAKAVELALGKPFDVALLDVKMPGLDGFQTLSEIKRVSPRTKVVLLTGHLSEADEQDGLESGAFAYLLKPHPISELVAVIESAANGGAPR
jgi:DNA-binding response OmpR family regulator